MGRFRDKLCFLLLEERFGSVISSIASNLLHDTNTLKLLVRFTNLPVTKVSRIILL